MLTVNLVFYYAWIAFQNGYYECQTESKENAYVAKAERAEGKKWLTDFTEQGNCGKQGRNNNYSKTGYLNKRCSSGSSCFQVAKRTF